jgi:hypothetical protein
VAGIGVRRKNDIEIKKVLDFLIDTHTIDR